MISDSDIEIISSSCSSLYNIDNVYFELVRLYPNSSSRELMEYFLFVIYKLLERGRLRFIGELHLLEDGVPLFGESIYEDWDCSKKGARPADDPSPEGVVQLIREKWPSDLVPAIAPGRPGFDPVWFYKWEFRWCDDKG